MNMKMSYSALLVLFLSLTFFTASTLAAGLKGRAFVAPLPCPDDSCGIPRPLPPYKPPPLY
ncbi:hypothetical protein AAZX31_10G122900 [Glycine max]|nr:hypothetical protein GLYMA_10G129133v4 [Glycine max]KAH1137998.1 hypothetical protein GYH30_027839 [Glycine max]